MPQSMRLGSVPGIVAGITRNPARRFTAKAGIFIILATIILGSVCIYNSPEILSKFSLLPCYYFYFGSSPSTMDSTTTSSSMLSDEATQDTLRNEQPIGAPHATTFLLGIFSMNTEEEKARRELIRKTMLAKEKEDERICSLKDYLDYAKMTGSQTQNCISPYVFVIAAGGEHRPTEYEDNGIESIVLDPSTIPDAEDDCIYLNIKENKDDGKSVTYFKFGQSIATQFGIDYIGKTNSDSLIDMNLYLDFLMNDLAPAPYNRRTYGGSTWTNNDKSSIYAAGQFYFMSADLAEYISVIMSHERRMELTNTRPYEDMDVGAFVFSHPRPIKFISLSQYTFWAHHLKSEEEWMTDYEEGMTKYPLRSQSVIPVQSICYYLNMEKQYKENECLRTCYSKNEM